MHPRIEVWIPKEKEDVTDISPREGGRAFASNSNQQLTRAVSLINHQLTKNRAPPDLSQLMKSGKICGSFTRKRKGC